MTTQMSDRDAALIEAYEEGPISLNGVGQRFGISSQRVAQIFKRLGYTNRYDRGDINRVTVTCPGCGDEHKMTVKAAKKFTFCSGRCAYRVRFKDAREKHKKAYEMRKTGATWKTIAEDMDFINESVACNSAKRHAIRKKKPWPIPSEYSATRNFSTPIRGRPEQAYMARADGKLSWKYIADHLGYQSETSAINCAKQYAQRYNLPWPVVRQGYG